MTPVRIAFLALLAGVLFLFSCRSPNQIKMQDFKDWWRNLSEEEREIILRDTRGNPEVYRVNLSEEGEQIQGLKEFADWVNKLSPAMIEAYELHLLENSGKETRQSGVLNSIRGSPVVRTMVCRNGTMVKSKECSPGVPKVTPTECLRCVPGIAKESKP